MNKSKNLSDRRQIHVPTIKSNKRDLEKKTNR